MSEHNAKKHQGATYCEITYCTQPTNKISSLCYVNINKHQTLITESITDDYKITGDNTMHKMNKLSGSKNEPLPR